MFIITVLVFIIITAPISPKHKDRDSGGAAAIVLSGPSARVPQSAVWGALPGAAGVPQSLINRVIQRESGGIGATQLLTVPVTASAVRSPF
jgi:hypothetical protein